MKTTINIFGDFVTSENMSNVAINESLKDILSAANYNVLNYEGVLIKDAQAIVKTGPTLFQHVSTIDWVKSQKFNLLNLANNHTMDNGANSLIYTMSIFKNHTVGAGSWEEAYKPHIVEINDIRIAFVSFTHCEFGVLNDEWDRNSKIGTAWINHNKVNKTISKLKNNCDIIIALPHAGIEYEEQPLPEWRTRYRELIDLGCDAVIGSHPHIIQGCEEYKGKLICYSLGNFFFPKSITKPISWYYSICAHLIIDENKSISYKIIPIHFDNFKIEAIDNTDTYFQDYFDRINEELNNDDRYIDLVKTLCKTKYADYIENIGSKELIPLRINERFIKRLIRYILGKKDGSVASMLNVIRCESHRFCFLRGLKLLNNIQ